MTTELFPDVFQSFNSGSRVDPSELAPFTRDSLAESLASIARRRTAMEPHLDAADRIQMADVTRLIVEDRREQAGQINGGRQVYDTVIRGLIVTPEIVELSLGKGNSYWKYMAHEMLHMARAHQDNSDLTRAQQSRRDQLVTMGQQVGKLRPLYEKQFVHGGEGPGPEHVVSGLTDPLHTLSHFKRTLTLEILIAAGRRNPRPKLDTKERGDWGSGDTYAYVTAEDGQRLYRAVRGPDHLHAYRGSVELDRIIEAELPSTAECRRRIERHVENDVKIALENGVIASPKDLHYALDHGWNRAAVEMFKAAVERAPDISLGPTARWSRDAVIALGRARLPALLPV